MRRAVIAIAASAFSVGAVLPPAAEAAPKHKSFQQSACATGANPCVALTGRQSRTIIRTFAFETPKPGTATVNFSGSLYCANNGNGPRVVDLDVQIMDYGGAPSRSAAGGMRIAGVLPGPQSFAYSTTYSLAATRLITVYGDSIRGVYFVVDGNIGADVTCWVYNASFTVDVFND